MEALCAFYEAAVLISPTWSFPCFLECTKKIHTQDGSSQWWVLQASLRITYLPEWPVKCQFVVIITSSCIALVG